MIYISHYIYCTNFTHQNFKIIWYHTKIMFLTTSCQPRRRRDFFVFLGCYAGVFQRRNRQSVPKIPNFRRLRRGYCDIYILYIVITENRIKTSKTPNYIYITLYIKHFFLYGNVPSPSKILCIHHDIFSMMCSLLVLDLYKT